MKEYKLKSIHSEGFENLLVQVKTAFNTKLASNELVPIRTYGPLCDPITAKIPLDHSDDCTSQQAFGKLAATISLALHNTIASTNSSVSDLFLRLSRHSVTKNVAKYLDF